MIRSRSPCTTKIGAWIRAIFARELNPRTISGPIIGATIRATSCADVNGASTTTAAHGLREARSTATALPIDSPCRMTWLG